MIEILSEAYGKENIYILCKNKWKVLYELQGYKNIFVDETKWSIFYKIKLYRKLNRINFSKIIILNNSYIPEESEFIYNVEKYDTSEKVDYILGKYVILLKKVLKKDFKLTDVVPDIKKYFFKKEYFDIIAIAVGTADYPKSPTYKNLNNYIENILKDFPHKRIFLLGTGEKQNYIAEKLKNNFGSERIVNLIDRINLTEVIQVINDCDLFIGGDSGLFNIAFSLNKKCICLHWNKNKSIWEHPFENIKILKGKGGKEYIDKKYGTETLNSISYEQIKNAIDELKVLEDVKKK